MSRAMAADHERAVQLLNDVKLSSDATEKVNLLKSLQEIVIKKEPSLIPTFLPEVLELQVDPAPAVRRQVLDLFDAAVQARPDASLLEQGLRCITYLLQDSVPATVKRAVVSSYPTYRAALAYVVAHGSGAAGVQGLAELWQTATGVRSAITTLATASTTNSGVKLSASKFIEQGVMLHTADVVPAVAGILPAPQPFPANNPVVSKAALVKDGEQLLGSLAVMLKNTADQEETGPLAIACIRTGMTIIQQRPQFIGRVLPLLLPLTKIAKFKIGDGPPATHAAALKAALTAAMDSKHPMAAAWKKKVADGLVAMGAPPPREVSPSPPPTRSLKRPRDEEAPAAAPSPAVTYAAVQQADTVVRGLVASRDAPNLAAFVQALAPELLVELVLGHLPSLPPRHAWIPDYVPHEPWINDLVDRMQQPGAMETPKEEEMPQAEAPHRESSMDREVPAKQAPALPRVSVPVPADILAPIELSEQEKSNHRRKAVLRILETEKTAAHALRTSLVGRLAACAPDTDRITDGLLEYIFQDFHNRRGADVAMSLLFFLFAEQCGAAPPDDGGSGGAQPGSPSLEGSRYEDALLSLLEGLQQHLPPTDRTIVTLLLEAPALPMPRVKSFLADLCAAGPDHATLALVAARDVVLTRPPSRADVLDVVLQASIAADADLRTKAVRLLANRLFPEPSMSNTIEHFARRQLDSLTEKAAASEVAATADGTEASEPPVVEDSTAVKASALYCALCTKKHTLLRHLFEVFGACSAGGQAAILANAPGLAKTMGAAAPALLAVVQDPPTGSLDLVLKMVHTLTQAAMPPPLLVAACMQLFSMCKDPRVLSPVLPGLERSAVLRLLPAVLELPLEELKLALGRLCTAVGGDEAEPLFAPSELLAALHTLDAGGDANVIRRSMTAINVCLNTPDLFPAEALATTINQLLTRVPLPQLFMRTVIQSLAAAPRLRPFVVGVLNQLVAKQIWNDATQWRGWVMAAQQTAPESFPALLQLPSQVLAQALGGLPAATRGELASYASSPQCKVTVTQATKEVLASSQSGAPPQT